MAILKTLKEQAGKLKVEIIALTYALRHPRTPWSAKALIVLVTGYALSPIDLVPDFIPVVGQIDDLILLPLGIAIAIKMIPKDVLSECRQKAEAGADMKQGKNWIAGVIIILLWLSAVALAGICLWKHMIPPFKSSLSK